MDGSEVLGGPLAAWKKLSAASGFGYCRLLGDGLNVCCFPLLLVAAFVANWGAARSCYATSGWLLLQICIFALGLTSMTIWLLVGLMGGCC